MFVKLTRISTGEVLAKGTFKRVDIVLTDPHGYPQRMVVVPESWFASHDAGDLRLIEQNDSAFIHMTEVRAPDAEAAA